jgi:hypothetical protein
MFLVFALSRPIGRPPLASVLPAPSGAERIADIMDKSGEAAPQRLAPSDKHVIAAGLRLKRRSGAQSLFQTPADAIALDRASDALAHGQTHARAEIVLPPSFACAGLEREGLDRYARSARDALKFGAFP